MNTPTALVALLVPLATKDWLQPTATVITAVIAAVGVFITVRVQRRSVKVAERAATASELSAAASERSSKAAEEAVGVNRETASGVARRAEADALAKRYQDAATQLGHDKAPVRLAGVYAMARLADDWDEQRQACVEVLCSYLRMQPSTQQGEDEVRRTVTTQIAARLQKGAPKSWSDLPVDLSWAHLAKVNFKNAVFGKRANFAGTSFDGSCLFRGAVFHEGVDFTYARVLEGGELRLEGVDFGRITSFDRIECQSGSELVLMQRGQSWVDCREARIYGHFAILLDPSNEGEFYDLGRLEVREAGKVEIKMLVPGRSPTIPTGKARVRLESVRVADSGKVDISQSLIDAGIVHWGITSKASAESLSFTPPPVSFESLSHPTQPAP